MSTSTRLFPNSRTVTDPGETGSRGLSKLHSVAAAALLCATLVHTGDAHALALGRVVVQSALGEPLRAEIEVLEASADEAAALKVNLATADMFRSSGMELNPALSGASINLQRRADGRTVITIIGNRPVTEPFVDMVLEANWASGRVVREYTVLIDPPRTKTPAPAPVNAATGASPATAAATKAKTPAAGAAQAKAPAAAAPAAKPEKAAAAPAESKPTAPSGSGQVTVRAGETAGNIASAYLPENTSLDQMLVAMLRANPKAFIGGNVNRIKAGAILDLPTEEATASVSAPEARRIVAAQSRDFNEFRRRMAGAVPAANVAAADRQATGKVEAAVEDKKPTAAIQDKLTLSKGAVAGKANDEDKIAKDRQAQEAANRKAEIERNMQELAKLDAAKAGAAKPAPATDAKAPPAKAPAAPVTAPAPTAAQPATPAAAPAVPAPTVPTAAITTPTTAPAPASDATAPAAADKPAEVTPPPAAAEPAPKPPEQPKPAKKPTPPKPAPAPEEPSFVDQLLGNPFVLPGAGALLAIIGGLVFYRSRQKKKKAAVDSSFLESRLQPDSFFGSSGGQRIDTSEAAASGSSMVYSPSQLDAAGDVDPVAEADVYLAYGRDLQAEEILKEAMRSTPTRVAIYNKLMEIYAKRRDSKAFEVVATEAYGLTQGQGQEWEHACELGKELDPSNPLYQPGGAPAVKPGAEPATPGGVVNTIPFGASTLGQPLAPAEEDDNGGLDLDLDFIESASAPLASEDRQPRMDPDDEISAMDDLSQTEALTAAPVTLREVSSRFMDFDLEFPSEPAPLNPASGPAPLSSSSGRAASTPDLELGTPLTAGAAKADDDLMSFDLDAINDRKGMVENAEGNTEWTSVESPLETKLSLAEEFRAIGDLEGARSLAEEVLAEASGPLKAKVSAFLADLS